MNRQMAIDPFLNRLDRIGSLNHRIEKTKNDLADRNTSIIRTIAEHFISVNAKPFVTIFFTESEDDGVGYVYSYGWNGTGFYHVFDDGPEELILSENREVRKNFVSKLEKFLELYEQELEREA